MRAHSYATRSQESNEFWEFLRKIGDVLLVTQYGVHLWTSYPDKNVVQLLVWMFDVPTTILYGIEEDIPCSPW